MALSQLLNVKWSANERIDLDDLAAMSSLKDADIAALLSALVEPGAYGRVLTGFLGTIAGPSWSLPLGAPHVAVAPDGSFLLVPSGTGAVTTLVANATNYVHAYVYDLDYQLDNRRILNDAVSPAEEVTANIYTRLSRSVGIYIFTNSDATPLLGSFQTSALIGGKVRSLVALGAYKTDVLGNVTSSVDFRQMWAVNGNQVPTVNGGADELPFTFPAVNGDRNIKGVRSAVQALASVVRELGGDPAVRDWWDTTFVRTDSRNSVEQPTLRDRITAVRTALLTVDQVYGDLGSLELAFDQLSPSPGFLVGLADVFVRAGTLPVVAPSAFANTTGLHIRGAGPSATKLEVQSEFIFNTPASEVSFSDMTISRNGASSLFHVMPAGEVTNLTFRNCRFLGSRVLLNEGTLTNVRFENCTFEWADDLFPRAGAGGGNITLEGCYLVPSSTSAHILPSGGDLTMRGCVVDGSLVGGWQGITPTAAAATDSDVTVRAYGCRFIRPAVMVNGAGDAVLDVELHDCRVEDAGTGGFANTLFIGAAFFRLLLDGCVLTSSRNLVDAQHSGAVACTVALSITGSDITVTNGTNAIYLVADTTTVVLSATKFNLLGPLAGHGYWCVLSGFTNGKATLTANAVTVYGANSYAPFLLRASAGTNISASLNAVSFFLDDGGATPIKMEQAAVPTKSALMVSGAWANVTDGAVSDSGVTNSIVGGTVRVESSNFYRMLYWTP